MRASTLLKFIYEYVSTGDAGTAYGNATGIVATRAQLNARAAAVLKSKGTQELIEMLRQEVREKVVETSEGVLKEVLAIATSDINDVVQYRRLCCRYCHGTGHHYQWISEEEFNVAVEIAKDQNSELMAKGLPAKLLPTSEGGYGYRRNAFPNDDCPKCFGEGLADVFIKDTRRLTAAQRKIISSIKQTKEGVEIKMHDKVSALTTAARMLGGFKQTVILQNPDGSNIAAAPDLPDDPVEAAALYKKWMSAKSDPV